MIQFRSKTLATAFGLASIVFATNAMAASCSIYNDGAGYLATKSNCSTNLVVPALKIARVAIAHQRYYGTAYAAAWKIKSGTSVLLSGTSYITGNYTVSSSRVKRTIVGTLEHKNRGSASAGTATYGYATLRVSY